MTINGPVQRGKRPRRPTNARIQEKLIALLPGKEVTNLLVDTYFDRAHWFILVFRQQEFRQKLLQLHEDPSLFRGNDVPSAGFLALLLAVVCIGLQYVGKYRESLLRLHGVHKEALQDDIVAVLEESFLAIVSLGSLEAVQTLVLLGTFHLYHCDPAAAWSICGCALRISQALQLHKKWPPFTEMHHHLSPEVLRQIEARKRCWWAIYEVETFCCMLYGYRCSILDSDCDMDFLADFPQHALDTNPEIEFTLLAYKGFMSRLSVIVKTALNELYTRRTDSQEPGYLVAFANRREQLLRSVSNLDRRLALWHADLPIQLRVGLAGTYGYDNVEQSERDVGGSGKIFDQNITQLQAISLELAHQNAKILIHRPLLTYKLYNFPAAVQFGESDRSEHQDSTDGVHQSSQTCGSAAIQMVEVGNHSAFKFAVRSYAAAFLSTHLFTAGVALCLSAIAAPLTDQASQAKLALRKLFQLLSDPDAEPLASPHVTKILKCLMLAMLEREMSDIQGSATGIPPARAERRPTSHVGTDHVYNKTRSTVDETNSATLGASALQTPTVPGTAETHCLAGYANASSHGTLQQEGNTSTNLFQGNENGESVCNMWERI